MNWTIKRHGYESPYMVHAFIEDEKGSPICGLWWPEGDKEQEANAKLIVEAPALRERAEKAEAEKQAEFDIAQQERRFADDARRERDAFVRVLDPEGLNVVGAMANAQCLTRERDKFASDAVALEHQWSGTNADLEEAREDIKALAILLRYEILPGEPKVPDALANRCLERIRDRKLLEVSDGE